MTSDIFNMCGFSNFEDKSICLTEDQHMQFKPVDSIHENLSEMMVTSLKFNNNYDMFIIAISNICIHKLKKCY
jgi:hypothetical protein